jgi:glycosyltransferase involved in cell wall biosynthesis
MKLLFISNHSWPHVGGVEKHIKYISKELSDRGHSVKIISEENIKYPPIKFFGLLFIWFWLFKNRKLIKEADIVHIHDVYIWYLPFRFIYLKKKVYITIHGGQGKWPIPLKNKLLVKLAVKLSSGTICVGNFIPKYFGVKDDYVIYGGVDKKRKNNFKKEKLIIFLGRLEKETGVYDFVQNIKGYDNYRIEFVGDGRLRSICKKYGIVHGFCDPVPFLQKAEICFAGGYLSALEALEYGCKLWTSGNTPIKKYYWKVFPYKKGDKLPSWESVAGIYESLYLYNS